MKKLLLIGIPVAIVVVLLTAHSAQSLGFRGQAHHGMSKDFMEYKLDRLSKELKLDSSQQAKLDQFKGELGKLFEQRMEKKKETKDLIAQELAKQNPDVVKIQRLIDQRINEAAQIGHEMVQRVGTFYQDLTPEQRKLFNERVLDRLNDSE